MECNLDIKNKKKDKKKSVQKELSESDIEEINEYQPAG